SDHASAQLQGSSPSSTTASGDSPSAKRTPLRGRRPPQSLTTADLPTGEMPGRGWRCCLICGNCRSTALGTISARETEHGVKFGLGAGDVSNAGNSVHYAKRRGVEVAHPPPWPGLSRLGWCGAPPGGVWEKEHGRPPL